MKKILVVILTVILALGASGYGILKLSSCRSFQLFGGIVQRVNTSEKAVALTFDDGPTKEHTDEVLALLKELDVKATFFVIGDNLERCPEEGRKIAAAGHELGNHTYSHNRMIFKTPSFIKEEIEKTDKLIRETGYTGEIHFRPPNGKKLVLLPSYLSKQGRKTIMWDMEPDSIPDIAGDSSKITRNVTENIKPGSIILMHVMYDSRGLSREALKDIVTGLRGQGYTFKTVSELLQMQKAK